MPQPAAETSKACLFERHRGETRRQLYFPMSAAQETPSPFRLAFSPFLSFFSFRQPLNQDICIPGGEREGERGGEKDREREGRERERDRKEREREGGSESDLLLAFLFLSPRAGPPPDSCSMSGVRASACKV